MIPNVVIIAVALGTAAGVVVSTILEWQRRAHATLWGAAVSLVVCLGVLWLGGVL